MTEIKSSFEKDYQFARNTFLVSLIPDSIKTPLSIIWGVFCFLGLIAAVRNDDVREVIVIFLMIFVNSAKFVFDVFTCLI